MNPEIPINIREEITQLIGKEDSPVGIDAKETHIIIIHKLLEIEKRLQQIEQKIS